MIFATVGLQLPFDRMVHALDQWQEKSRNINVFAQIGCGGQPPRNIDYAHQLSPLHFEQALAKCTVMVAHAGIGSVLMALKAQKPLIIMPRKASLHEHRNDHQLATAAKLADIGGVMVARNEADLITHIDAMVARLTAGACFADDPLEEPKQATSNEGQSGQRDQGQAGAGFRPYASPQLLTSIATFIAQGEV